MKIGILTHHYISNYGAFLQTYALAEAVAKEFPQDTVEVIDYINVKHFVANFGGWFRFYRNKERLKHWKQKIKTPFMFAAERKKHLSLSPRCYTAKGINRQNYDVIIIGSDEVWNYADKKSTAAVKFCHGLTCGHIIAYAPSIGGAQQEPPQYVHTGLQKFAAISSRDTMTAKMVETLTGKTPPNVLDPTFLENIPECENPDVKKPYILFYYCDRLPGHIKDQIIQRARENNRAVYGAGEWDYRYDDLSRNLTPFEWANMFRNAEYVFTGTFHGAVFSILNQRPFKVYLTNKSRIQKVGSLLESLGIDGRQIDNKFVFNMDAENERSDYEKIAQVLAERRRQSLDFLHDAIEKGRRG